MSDLTLHRPVAGPVHMKCVEKTGPDRTFKHYLKTDPVGDAEAYECSLGEPEMDQDAIDEDLEDLQKDLEALEQQLLGDSDDEEEDEEEDEDEDEDEEEEGEDDE